MQVYITTRLNFNNLGKITGCSVKYLSQPKKTNAYFFKIIGNLKVDLKGNFVANPAREPRIVLITPFLRLDWFEGIR